MADNDIQDNFQPPELPPRVHRQNHGLQLIRTPPILKLSMDLDTYLRRFNSYAQSIGAPPVIEDIDEPDYVSFLRDAMYDIHEYALTNLNAGLVTTKDRFDKGQFGKPYVKDDLVWRLKGRFESGSRKFQKRYDGIYVVLEKLSNTSYHIKHLKTQRRNRAL